MAGALNESVLGALLAEIARRTTVKIDGDLVAALLTADRVIVNTLRGPR